MHSFSTRVSTVALATILALSASLPALSADLKTSDPTSANYTAPAAGWSGPWIGVAGGYSFFNTEVDYTHDYVGEETVNIEHLNINGLGAEGLFGEAQIGYDHQVSSSIVLGVFAGANLSDAEFSASYSIFGDQVAKLTSDYKWGGVAGARVGVVTGPNTMFYLAGGYAYAQLGDTVATLGDESASLAGPELHGWFGEVGMEHRLSSSVSLSVSGRYVDYGKETLWSGGNEICPREVEIDVDNLAVLAGLKFKLNGGLGF